MTKLLAGPAKAISLQTRDTELAKQSSIAISLFLSAEERPLHLSLEDRLTGEEIHATVPGVAVRLLAEALAKLGGGDQVAIIPLKAELSTQQAGDILGVSRPYFIKLLDQGRIPYRKVGEQRRVRYQDLLAYIEAYQKEATAALDEMAAETQRLGLND